MSFSLIKKKRVKFQVELMVADLNHVPFVNAVLFVKVRLLDGGNFCEQSPRVAVINHHAVWGKTFRFICRIAASHQTGILEPCLCRISIRKELKGGKSFHKLGFVDVNLSEFAGSGVDGLTRSYLLEGYNGGCQRQDNSLLRINAGMTLQSADPCFIVPPAIHTPICPEIILNPSERRAPGDDRGSMSSASSSGIGGSLGRQPKHATGIVCTTQIAAEDNTAAIDDPAHTRNSSQTSGSTGYSSADLTHSRRPSSESGNPMRTRRYSSDMTVAGTTNSLSVVSTCAGPGPSNVASLNRLAAPALKKRIPSANEVFAACTSSQTLLGSTRVDPGSVIDELMKGHDLQVNAVKGRTNGDSGLQLFVSKEDGSATLVGSRDARSSFKEGLFEQVVIADLEDQRR